MFSQPGTTVEPQPRCSLRSRALRSPPLSLSVHVVRTIGGVNRAVDVAIAGTGLALASPLLAAAAVAVKLSDGGPVLYRQTRVGLGGADFELLKLRTMVPGAETLGAGYAVNE